jgi:hypothetical protein
MVAEDFSMFTVIGRLPSKVPIHFLEHQEMQSTANDKRPLTSER